MGYYINEQYLEKDPSTHPSRVDFMIPILTSEMAKIAKQHANRSRWKSPLLCVVIYIAVVCLAWLGSDFSHWILAPVSIIIIAALHVHLMILLHEGAHYLLHPNKTINNFLGDFFCAIPLLTLQSYYRIFHLEHHQYNGDLDNDPEVPMYRAMGHQYQKRNFSEAIRLLLKDLTGINTLRYLQWNSQYTLAKIKAGKIEKPGIREFVLRFIIWGGVVTIAYYFNLWLEVFLFWIVPLLFVSAFFVKLHGYGEHNGATTESAFENTLTHDFNPITNFFLYPIKSGYHLEHHLYPGVPWYNMMAFRKELLKNPAFVNEISKLTVNGYFLGQKTVFKAILLGSLVPDNAITPE